jgi:hypothetical protein
MGQMKANQAQLNKKRRTQKLRRLTKESNPSIHAHLG